MKQTKILFFDGSGDEDWFEKIVNILSANFSEVVTGTTFVEAQKRYANSKFDIVVGAHLGGGREWLEELYEQGQKVFHLSYEPSNVLPSMSKLEFNKNEFLKQIKLLLKK